MTPLLLTAALLFEAEQAEARWQLPPLLLVAVVLHESGGRRGLVVRESGGRCSVGAAQVLAPHCDRARLRRLLALSVNLDEAGRILDRGRRLCERRPGLRCCRTHWVGAYNCGSPGYAARVLRVWRRLLDFGDRRASGEISRSARHSGLGPQAPGRVAGDQLGSGSALTARDNVTVGAGLTFPRGEA